jgi:hypothetical protein
LLLEQREFAHLSVALADESLVMAFSDSQEKVLSVIDGLATRADQDLSAWKAAVRETPAGHHIPSLTDRLGTMLLEIDLLEKLGIGTDKLSFIRSETARSRVVLSGRSEYN